jgi:hypothetical protein
LRDLVPEGSTELFESDPLVYSLKASGRLVTAIERAVRIYEVPPSREHVIDTPWGDVEIGESEWREAFDAADSGTPHNEARDQVWEALLDIIIDSFDADEVPPALLRRALVRNDDLTSAFARAWPVLDPAHVVADLWSVPEYLQGCAPWLSPTEVRALQRLESSRWTVSDLPFLDAARLRIGDPHVSRTRRLRERMAQSERDEMDRVVDDLIAADDDGEGLLTMLRGEDVQRSLSNESALPVIHRDRLGGPFAHVIVDEAQELTDAEWQMLLTRCPSRSFTIVGDRAQARHGFSESWEHRLRRLGMSKIQVASLTINYRTPEEIMVEATRSFGPHCRTRTCRTRFGAAGSLCGSGGDLT